MGNASDSNAFRIRRLRQLMKQRQCHRLLLTDPVDCRYASGFSSSNVHILLSARAAWLCTDFRYEHAARMFCRARRGWRLRPIAESDFTFLCGMVPQRAVLGIQSNALTLDRFESLKRALPGVRFVNMPELSDEVSIAKTAGELKRIAACARMADAALARTIPSLREGITEHQVRDILEEHCRTLGSDGPAFDTIVLFGRRSALPHGVASAARLRRGDFILIDFGCTREGMRSDMTRTLVKGRAGRRQRQVYETVLRAQRRACRAVSAGVTAQHIDSLAREVITEAGYGDAFGHATGHGVGYRIHEAPRIAARNASRLAENTVVTVEPGIYISNLGGVRIEDMVVAHGSGRRVLTRFPRDLMEV